MSKDEILLELKEKLNKPLPKEAIKQHPTKTYLSSIKAIYVTERLTEVFGVGGWKTKVDEVSCNKENGMVVVKVTLEVPKYDIYYESYGGNDNGGTNNKNFDLGDAYKGATTDAITKIGSYLGIGIDVFKGLKEPQHKGESKNPSQSAKGEDLDPEGNVKKWLSPAAPAWDKAIHQEKPLDQMLLWFKISKEHQQQYEMELTGELKETA